MPHRGAVVCNAPQRVLGSIGAQQACRVSRVECAVASPFAAVVASGKNQSVGGDVLVEGAHCHAEGLVERGVVGCDGLRI